MTLIKVAASSDVGAVAGAIAGMARENQRTEIQVVGAPAIHQAVKAIALANEYLREDRILVAFVPEYVGCSCKWSSRMMELGSPLSQKQVTGCVTCVTGPVS